MRLALRLLFVIVAVLGPISACEDDPDDLNYLKAGAGGKGGSSGSSGKGGAGGSHDLDAGD